MLDSSPGPVAFTPFVPRVREAVGGALADLLGLEAAESLSWIPAPEATDALAGTVRLGPRDAPTLELDLAPPAPDRRAFFAGRQLALSYRRRRDGADPYADPPTRAVLDAVRARLTAIDASPDPHPALALARARLQDAARFASIDDYMYRQARPRELVLRLGFRCNQDCGFCWQGRDWPEPDAGLYQTWLDEAARAGRRAVHFSGGEPTLHRALPDLVRRASHTHGMSVWLQTNAIRLGKPRYLKTLVDAGLRGVFVSYHAGDAALSDQMTRAPGTHGPTVRGIEACLAAGVTVELNCVVDKANVAHLPDHALDIVRRFVTPFPDAPVDRVSYSQPHAYFDRDLFRRNTVSLDVVRAPLLEALDVLTAAGVGVECLGTCGFPPCLLRDRPALLHWLPPEGEHPMDASARAYGAPCDACAARPRCLGVRRELLERHGDAGLVAFERLPS